MSFAPGLVGTDQDSEGGGERHGSPSPPNGNSSWRGSSLAGRLRHQSRRPSERRRIKRDLATSCFVGEPFAPSPYQSPIGAGLVVKPHLDPIVVAEVELGEVSVEVLLLNVLINTDQATLEDRKEA